MKKIVVMCLLCALCVGMGAGTASGRKLVVKKDNQVVAIYSEDEFDEVVFRGLTMVPAKDLDLLSQTYHFVEIKISERQESGNWHVLNINEGNDWDETYNFFGSVENEALTLDFPTLELKKHSFPDMKFEGVQTYQGTDDHSRYFEFAGSTTGTMPGTGDEFVAKMKGSITVIGGEYNLFIIYIDLYVGGEKEPLYKFEYRSDISG